MTTLDACNPLTGPACAHLKVVYRAERVAPPHAFDFRSWWQCDDCGKEFEPKAPTQERLALQEAELSRVRAAHEELLLEVERLVRIHDQLLKAARAALDLLDAALGKTAGGQGPGTN